MHGLSPGTLERMAGRSGLQQGPYPLEGSRVLPRKV